MKKIFFTGINSLFSGLYVKNCTCYVKASDIQSLAKRVKMFKRIFVISVLCFQHIVFKKTDRFDQVSNIEQVPELGALKGFSDSL